MDSGRRDLEDLTVRDVVARLATLSNLVAQQQDELTLLRERLATLGHEVPPAPVIAGEATASGDEQSFAVRRTLRRALLKTAGASAAAIVGTGLLAARDVQLGTAPHAEAADRSNLMLGNATASNTNNMASTRTTLTPVAGSTPDTLLVVDNRASTATSTDASNLAGITGYGAPAATGVLGVSNDNFNSYGVWGFSNQGYCVVGGFTSPDGKTGNGGIDIFAAGPFGRILQNVTLATGAPAASIGSFLKGEQLRDFNGDLYICTASTNTANNTPAVWERVAAVRPGYAGGAIHLLSTPIRLLDTRPGATAAVTPGKPLASGQPYTLQVTNELVNGVGVPAHAAGVIGNVTVTNTSGASDLRIYPTGVAVIPLVSAINWAAGWTIGHNVIAALSSNGQLDMQLDGANQTTDVVFDVVGFII